MTLRRVPRKRPAVFRHLLVFLPAAGAAVALLAAAPAFGQLPIPPSSQFDVTGFIQAATLDPSCLANAHCGGTLVVNGHSITVPRETIVIFPANALTWQEIFAQAPAPYGLGAVPMTGLAAADVPAPMTTYEAQVIGNRVLGAPGGDQYIAGLIYVSQQGLNSGSGFINFIDYTTGELRVGGALGVASGTRVRINDPSGRFGRAASPDPRFTVDSDNPTITSGTGFPMCIPRAAGVAGGPEPDPLCPQAQRPIVALGPPVVYLSAISTNDPVALPGVPPDATVQMPFEIGDFITFAGTLVHDGGSPTAGPWPAGGAASTYVSAHTIEDNIAVYTFPGSSPAYVRTDVTILGTGGLTVVGAGEAAIRTRFEGMSTDPSRNVHLYAVDVAPDGTITDRDWGTIGVDPGPPVGAVKGRWRFRPPCTAAVATDKACTPPPGGTFLPPPREVRAVIEGAWAPGQANAYANGIVAGQYHAPILEYIFPENVPGSAVVPNNFNTIPFLALGGYASSAGTVAGQLSPWPDSTTPTPACTPPTVASGGPYSVAAGGSVTLAGGASGTAPIAFAWDPPADGTLSDATSPTPVYSAPLLAKVVPLRLVATNACGSASAATSVTVNAAAAPTVAHVAPLSVFSGAPGSFQVSATDPGGLAVSFTVTQAPAVLLNLATGPVTCTGAVPSTCTATVRFTAPALPLGQVAPTSVNLTITATNAALVSGASEFTSVTVNPLPDVVAITATEYRTSKQRLVITASSSVVSPNVTLLLRPYVTVSGTTFDPSTLGNAFTNNGGGLYTLTLVGAPEPAIPPAVPLVVQSNLNGVSQPHGLDKIRQ